jgi:type III secretory pathway component EscR
VLQPSSFNPKREVRKETPKLRDEAFVCIFCGRARHLDEFCFHRKRIEKDTLTMLETHILVSSLIFCFILTLVLHLTLILVLCLVSLMDLTIALMVLVHKRMALCLNALLTATSSSW